VPVLSFRGTLRSPAAFEMNDFVGKTDNGLYRPGVSVLHRLDPRIKVLSSLTFVVLTFSARGWLPLTVLLAATGLALWPVVQETAMIVRLCLRLRWLLLFTFLMHLLFSPGRTLWGLSWLSFDGFLTGSFVCLQILLALIIASLTAMTTSHESLVGTFGWLTSPLQSLGCETDEWQRIFQLTLGFIPIVQEEFNAAATGAKASPADSSPDGTKRWSRWWMIIQQGIERLLRRGDDAAHELAAEPGPGRLSQLPPLLPLSASDYGFATAMIVVLALYWLAG
jgi:energy-coupling factor transport system permease protein